MKYKSCKARRALKLKIEHDFWRGWQEQGFLQEKGTIEHLAEADCTTTRALMVWSDDGGTAAIAPAEAFLLRRYFVIQTMLKPIRSLVRWFFGSPFRHLPPEFGETTPPDLRAFEVAAEEARHNAQGKVPLSFSAGSKRTRSDH